MEKLLNILFAIALISASVVFIMLAVVMVLTFTGLM